MVWLLLGSKTQHSIRLDPPCMGSDANRTPDGRAIIRISIGVRDEVLIVAIIGVRTSAGTASRISRHRRMLVSLFRLVPSR
jgi:hypothetical protein